MLMLIWSLSDGMPSLMTNEEPNPFDQFRDVAAVYAFCHATFGEAGLRELLAMVDTDQESLLRDAAELAEMGLLKASDIVAEAADTALPASVLHCPYAESDAYNFQNWQRGHRSRQMMAGRS
jgi:hypothetical protein